ncbi:MAG: ankyrin repeat domain-containing protein, partial [Syntrophorhabdus sp.]
YLIEKGANVAARNKDGETPLISIVYMDDKIGAVDLVNFFIKHGFDMRKDGNPKLLNESIRRNQKEVAFILLENGITFNDSTLFDAAATGYEEIFAYLLSKGASPVQKDILHAAAGSGNVNIIKMLLQTGQIPSPEDVDFALYKGNPDAAAYLNLVLKEEQKVEVDMKKRCKLNADPGHCKANFDAGYYDNNAKKCRLFSYGGCGGTVPFETVEACRAVCEQ